MSDKNTGEPAFPSIRDMRHSPDFDHEEGMTLRDYFAAKAMAAIIAKFPAYKDDEHPTNLSNAIAKGAYEYADSMMEARK